jgi:alcohol dehydrogenase class IV
VTAFRWQDGERLIVFGRGRIAEAGELLGSAYALLTTPRARTAAPAVVSGAEIVLDVPLGRVDELATALRSERHDGELFVALGGGRVIDVAKALAAAEPPRRVAAIPTTLSGAEMTAIHRHAAGVPTDTARVRPALVINDPDLSASQPLPELAASAANALGHALEAPLTTLSNPVAELAAAEAARQIASGLFRSEADRDALALGALLAGYAIGSAGYGLHHVLAQTLARFAGIGHGAANAVMLPHSLAALTRRFPGRITRLGEAIGRNPLAIAVHVRDLSGTTRLRDVSVSAQQLDQCADHAAARAELHLTPPAADRDELRALYGLAW